MNTTNHSLVILLDLQNQHERLGTIFDLNPQLFRRFINKDECLQLVSSCQTNVRLLHFFIPNSEHVEIGAGIVFFNTVYYIYCIDQASADQMRRQYNFPMYVKIFNVQSLSTYLRQVAMAHLIEQAERTKHEPDEHNIALQAAAELAETLGHELRNHMIVKLGEQPGDCR